MFSFKINTDSHLPKQIFASIKAFSFHLKTLFILKIFKFLSCLFGNVEKTA